MGNAQSCIVASVAVCSVSAVCVYIYSSHKLLKSNVINNGRLPSLVYLNVKYLIRALSRRTGCLYSPATKKSEVIYTILDCRLETVLLRRFCSAAGYSWDYPDTEYRDIPLCFPQFLCDRLLLMLLTDGGFRLSPAGLVIVRQSLKTLEPVDELKKGPFTLQARVLVYRQVAAGVEVDVCLTATSRTGCPVWESVLTLLSTDKLRKASGGLPRKENEGQPDEPGPENIKQAQVKVPRTASLQCLWSFSDFSPYWLVSLPAWLFGYRSQTSSSLWMLSVCLAEIEKHKGVGVITAPINITAQFKEPLVVPGRVTIKFWETAEEQSPSPGQGLRFHMQQHGSNRSHLTGLIFRSSLT